jgi:hypothetical protein
MTKNEFIDKWTKEMGDYLEFSQKAVNATNKLVFLSRNTTISDILDDFKKLNEETVSETK